MTILKGNVAHVKVTVERKVTKAAGVLFPPTTKYSCLIRVTDKSGNWEDYGKSLHGPFRKVELEMAKWKKDWIKGGMKEDQIEIDYTTCKAS